MKQKATSPLRKDKALYAPSTTPHLIVVPDMLFLAVDGQGDPNTSAAYQNAVEALYGLSYAIKMSKMDGTQPEGYYEYSVFPLEGLWDLNNLDAISAAFEIKDKAGFLWTSMIRQPEFVTQEVLTQARQKLARKKPALDTAAVRLMRYREGLCVQVMHLGPYDAEPATVRAMARFVEENGCVHDFDSGRRHHEIYLSDPRRTAPEKLKTVLRHPVAKAP